MRDAVLSACIMKKTVLHRCRLQGCSFFHTSLAGIDLTDNDIEGIVLSQSLSELRGAILSSEQCEVIARLLGVRVKS